MLQACIYGSPTRVKAHDVLEPKNKQEKKNPQKNPKQNWKVRELGLPRFTASNHLW